MVSKIPPGVLPNVKRICAEVVAACPQVTHVWGYGPNPDHNNRKCIDYMIRSTKDGNTVADYNLRHKTRLGVYLMIWNRRIIRSYPHSGKPPWTWTAYYGPNPHTDHPHVQYNAGTYRPPAGGGILASPTPAPQEGLFDMAKSVYTRATKDAKLAPKATYTDLKVNDEGGTSVVTGATKDVNVTAVVHVSGLKEGEVADFCWRIASYKKGTRTVYPHTRISVRATGTKNNLVSLDLTYNGGLPKQDGGRTPRLRLSYKTNSKTASVAAIQITGRKT